VQHRSTKHTAYFAHFKEAKTVKETLGLVQAALGTLRRIPQRIDDGLRSWRLLDRSRWVRKMTDMAIRGIEVESIPASLGEGKRAILVSNYPSVSQTLRAVMKVGCRLPGQRFRVKAIGRNKVVTEANVLLKALGADQHIFPALKDQSGKYVLESDTLKKTLAHLDGQGNILWLSVTGNTRANGLLERDLRTGAALFSLKKKITIVPMGLVTKEKGGRPEIVRVRFGEPVYPPDVEKMGEFARSDFLLDISRLMMCQIASLLPPGQRGDFEDVGEKLREVKERLDLPLLAIGRRT
jgi:1-acyl-sn-glycerol-3-phosphate acyltransferase